MLGASPARIGLGRQLLGGLGAARARLARERAALRASPLLALAQLPVGVAVAVLTTGGTLAAAEWVASRAADAHAVLGARRPARGLDRGHAADRARRASTAGATAGSRCRSSPPSRPRPLVAPRAGRRRRAVSPGAHPRACSATATLARWLASELLANAAWAGTLVFAGALFSESYGTSAGMTGCLLAVAACAYVAGNLACRRFVAARAAPSPRPARRPARDHRRPLRRRAPGRPREHAPSSPSAAFVAGGRTLIASGFALSTPPDLRPAVTSLRAATMQLGYFVGSIAGGAALALGGYSALGVTMGLFFLGAGAALVRRPIALRRRSGRPLASHASEHGLRHPRPVRGRRWHRALPITAGKRRSLPAILLDDERTRGSRQARRAPPRTPWRCSGIGLDERGERAPGAPATWRLFAAAPVRRSNDGGR